MKKEFDLTHRVLHWALAFGFLFIMLTVFLRLSWMEKNHVAAILSDGLAAFDITISNDQAIKIAKQIRKPMFDWHITMGYVVTGIFILRMLYNFTRKKKKRIVSFKEKFQNGIYKIFYALLGITLITGLLMEFGPESFKDITEDIHVLTLYYAVAFLVLHLAGIVLGENTDKKGIVSKMIGGGR